MNINVWSGFSKRVNSTKQPTGGTQKTVLLKEETDVESPSFILGTTDLTINYVEAFGRYYFAKCRSLDGNRTEIVCTPDRLATFKSQIGSASAFIQYATGGSNLIIDTRLPMKSGLTSATEPAAFPWTIDPLNGRYMLTVMSKTGVRTFNMDYASILSLMQDLNQWQDDIFNNIPVPTGTALDGLIYASQVIWAIGKQIMAFNDASGCLVNCVWLPINYGGGSLSRVYLGNFDTGHDELSMINLVETQPVQIDIPWVYNDWRNNSPFCQMYLYIPFVGNIQIDPSLCIGQTKLNLKFALSRCSGDCSVQVKAGSGITIGTYSVNLAAKYPVGAMQADPIKQMTGAGAIGGGIAATAIGIITGNPAMALGGAAAIGAAPAQFQPTPTVLGGMGGGSGAGLDDTIRLNLLYHDTSEVPGSSNASIGKPVMATHQISSYSGYVQCAGATVDIPGSQEDKDAVNGFLNSGFFYE